MAKIRFGPVVSDARGKQGGVVYTRNRGGAQTRLHVSPVQPRTSYQRAPRASLTTISRNWTNALTDSQRQAWQNLAAQLSNTDSLGSQIGFTGKELFSKLNQQLATAGQAPITDPPPALPTVTNQAQLTGAQNPSSGAIAITATRDPTPAEIAVLRATPTLNPARNNILKYLRVIYAGPWTSPQDITENWTNRFGPTLTENKIIWVNLRYLNTATGATSAPTQTKITLTTGADAMKQTTLTLTTAQILALPTTPVQILAAPGANIAINPISLTLTLHAGSTPYTVSGPGGIELQWASPPLKVVELLDSQGLLNLTSNWTETCLKPPTVSTNNPNLANQPLLIGINGTPSAGNGTLTITLNYSLDPTA